MSTPPENKRGFNYWPMALTLLVILAIIGALWLPRVEPLRSWRIRQDKPLVDGIIMRIENLYMHQHSSGIYLMQVRSRWIGGNPNFKYILRATLHATPDGPPIETAFWQVAIPPVPKDGATQPFDWQFRASPPSTSRLYLHVYYRSRDPGSKEESLVFDLPNLPQFIPGGRTSPDSD
jgi:hypothetical protein